MAKNMIQELIIGYKKSAAFFTAYQLGIFKYMKDRAVDAKELSSDLGLDHKMSCMFLKYLVSIGFLQSVDGKCQLSDEFSETIGQLDELEDILTHESNLFHKWISPDSITSSMIAGYGKRLFDVEGFSQAERLTYFKAMNGRNIDIIAFWIYREFGSRANINSLEIGRSLGRISLSLKNKLVGMNMSIVMKRELLSSYEYQTKESLQEHNPKILTLEDYDFSGIYDLVCMYNTIHYYSRQEAINLFRNLRKCMKEQSVICIADIFIKEKDGFADSCLLDWITNGGVYNLSSEEVESILNEAGFKITSHKTIDQISTDILFGVLE